MGLLNVLGKIGKAAVGFIPGVGPIAKGALDMVGDASSVLGKQQQGAADGRVTQAQLQQGQDRNALARYQAEQGAQFSAGQQDLQRQGFESTNRSDTAKQALIGALLGGKIDPLSFSGGKSSGGLLRALQANPEALAAMKTLGSQGAAAQNAPASFSGGELLKAPSLTPLAQTDKGGFLSTLANIGQIAGAAGAHLPQIDTSGGKAASGSPFNPAGPQSAGVNPFVLPPKGRLLPELEDDWSNR